MSIFQKVKLDNVCINITDGKHADCEPKENSGYYFISSKDVFNGSINYENARQITETDFQETHRRTNLEEGDILITNSGTIGRMALVKNCPNTTKTTFQKSVAIIKPNNQIIDNRFFYYTLLSKHTQLVNLGGGSAQHNLLLGDLRKFEIIVPDISAQRTIGSTIGAYDELIENNEKRIKTLEEMTQLLYTEWFVKFNYPSNEKVKMMDSSSAYGMIPEGWKVGRLSEVASIVRGCSYSSDEINDLVGNFYIVNLKSFNRGGGFRFDGNKYYSGKISDDQQLKQGDIVVAVTDMTTDRAVIARPARIPDINGKITFSADVVKVNSDTLPNSFLYQLLSSYLFTETTKQKANGANVLHLRPNAILEFVTVIPDQQILKYFEDLCSPTAREVDILLKQNDNLAKTRDLLIPQLVTGKMELKN